MIGCQRYVKEVRALMRGGRMFPREGGGRRKTWKTISKVWGLKHWVEGILVLKVGETIFDRIVVWRLGVILTWIGSWSY
jgi:hypothetical protein